MGSLICLGVIGWPIFKDMDLTDISRSIEVFTTGKDNTLSGVIWDIQK